MLITASHHFPSLQIHHCLMIHPPPSPSLHPPPHLSIYLPSVSPPPLSYLLWVKMQHEASALSVGSDCSILPLLSVTIHHFIHFSPHPSVSPSLFVYLPRGRCDMRKRWSWLDGDCNIPSYLSVIIYGFIRFPPSALTLFVALVLI